MLESTFWPIRYSLLAVCLAFAAADVAVIVWHRLYTRIIMVYVLVAVCCQGLMSLSAFFFSSRFVSITDGEVALTD